MYADATTESMRAAIQETDRRRRAQEAYNLENGITPASIVKAIDDVLASVYERDYVTIARRDEAMAPLSPEEAEARVADLQRQMREAAANLEFEKAAAMRDEIRKLRKRVLGLVPSP